MTRGEKLAQQLLSCPATFRFQNLVKVMRLYGFELDAKGRISGSRVRFYRESDGRMFIMHVPHPGDELSTAAVRQAARFLEEAGAKVT